MAHIIWEMITNDYLTYQMKYYENVKLTIKYELSPGNNLKRAYWRDRLAKGCSVSYETLDDEGLCCNTDSGEI